MKKMISAILALSLASTTATSVCAINVTQDNSLPQNVDTTITTTIEPSYIVEIPDSVSIPFNSNTTSLGTIKATKLQIEPNKTISVSAKAGSLLNQVDKTSMIPYKIMNGDAEFSSIVLADLNTKAGLTVDVTSAAWNSAPAGNYSGTITFTVSYK